MFVIYLLWTLVQVFVGAVFGLMLYELLKLFVNNLLEKDDEV